MNNIKYLPAWEYNANIILIELEKIVKNNGGKIVSTWKQTPRNKNLIVNRSLLNIVEDLQTKKERFLNIFKKDLPEEDRERLQQAQQINNEPRESVFEFLYTSFILNGVYYYYQLDSNPFFSFGYCKTAVNDNTIKDPRRLLTDPREWEKKFNCYGVFYTDEDRVKVAQNIFDMLLNAETTPSSNKAPTKKIYIIED